jgi:hypothetical protein
VTESAALSSQPTLYTRGLSTQTSMAQVTVAFRHIAQSQSWKSTVVLIRLCTMMEDKATEGLSHQSLTGKYHEWFSLESSRSDGVPGLTGGRNVTVVATKSRKVLRMVTFNISPGHAVAFQDCFNTTKLLIWVCFNCPILCCGDLMHTGHCWADTEPNLSQISVPQGPAPIRASEIVMNFFDKVSTRSQ